MADHLPITGAEPMTPSPSELVGRRLRPVAPWLVLGVAATVTGGLVAAAVAHDPTQKPVWASAYLVLVAGLSQIALALGRALLAPRPPHSAVITRDFALFTVGNAAVLIGTLTDALWLVDVGGALLVGALGLMIWGVRAGPDEQPNPRSARRVGLLWLYRVLVLVLLVSIPIGLLLAR